jgi:hypothetical protein
MSFSKRNTHIYNMIRLTVIKIKDICLYKNNSYIKIVLNVINVTLNYCCY